MRGAAQDDFRAGIECRIPAAVLLLRDTGPPLPAPCCVTGERLFSECRGKPCSQCIRTSSLRMLPPGAFWIACLGCWFAWAGGGGQNGWTVGVKIGWMGCVVCAANTASSTRAWTPGYEC